MKRINLIKFPPHSWGRYNWKVNNIGVMLYDLSKALGGYDLVDRLFGESYPLVVDDWGGLEEILRISPCVTTKNCVLEDLKDFLKFRRRFK